MRTIRDHVGDANPSYLYKAAESVDLPDFILKSPMMSEEDVADLHDKAFADSDARMFPIHTKEAALMSAIAYFGQGGTNARTQARIRNAAAQHGVFDLEQEIERCFEPEQVKSASGQEPLYALKIEGGDGPPQYLYPISDAGEIAASARYLTKDAAENRLPLSFVRDAAREIVKRAETIGVDPEEIIPQAVLNMGTDRIPNFDAAKSAADRRLEFCGIPESAHRILVESVEAAKEAHAAGEDIEDFVEVWRMVDDGAQIKYSALIKDPYQAFFSGETRSEVEKFAKSIVFVGDVPVPSEVVGALSDDDVDGFFRAVDAATVKQARDAAVQDAPEATHLLSGLSDESSRALLQLLLSTSAA